MNSYPITALQDGTRFTNHVFLDEGFQLLDSEVPFSDSLKKILTEWKFSAVLSDGTPKNPGEPFARNTEASATQDEQKKEIPQNVTYESIDINDLLGLPPAEKEESLAEKAVIEDAPELPDAPPSPEPSPTQEEATAARTEVKYDEKTRLAKVKEEYDTYLEFVNKVYTHYATHKAFDMAELTAKVRELCMFIRNNQRYVLRLIPSERERTKNFLVSHSIRSTVIAITIGLTLHLPILKLIDLGIACIIHEIGQIRLPPQLYMTDRLLTKVEKAKMETHPIIGFNIAKEHGFSLAVQLAIIEHHERENGTGYPRHLTGDHISSFAKIIAVACSFEAISAPRHFREARTPYEAMVEMLHNHDHAYDETVIKALLYSLSLFPIGAFVQLASGKIAQVTDVNPSSPKNPIVQIVDETNEKGEPLTIQTDDTTERVVRVLGKQESEALKKKLAG